jgi:hypothetical protein
MNRKSIIECKLKHGVSEVWRVVTDNRNYSWRSDIKSIKILSATSFTEQYKDGGQTEFTIISKEENRLYQFEMNNKLFSGRWVGEFFEMDDTSTKLVFTEYIYFKNPLFYMLSFFMVNLKKIQETYMKDLKKELESEN